MSCSQPWVLWQPCAGRWVLAKHQKHNTWCFKSNPKLRRSHLFVSAPPASSIPTECVCSSNAVLCSVLPQQRSPVFETPHTAPFLWRRWDAVCVSSADSVAEATPGSTLDGGNIALAVFILVLLLSVLLGGAYVYVTRWALDYQPDLRDRLWRAVFA